MVAQAEKTRTSEEENTSVIRPEDRDMDQPTLNGVDSQAQSMKTILVTGGAGYIGSHTCVQLLLEGFSVVVVDNLDNSSEEALNRVRRLAGEAGDNLMFFKIDLCDLDAMESLFNHNRFDAVIHFAGLKAVGESVKLPLRYYRNNVVGTMNLLDLMSTHGCKKIVFSSSATVYGQPQHVPCLEDDPHQTLNPYARTKLYIENILGDVHTSDSEWRTILLRYFNPVGAHPSGRIGEDPRGIPNNLMPYIQQVAVGRRSHLSIFGSDYPTSDGTGVRDYVHVIDLATGHVAALRKLFACPEIGCEVYNLGTGKGTSVLEMVAAFEKAAAMKINVKMCPRRPGDASEVYASTEKAERELGWRAKHTVEDMCLDQWTWARNNPWGYASGPEEPNVTAEDEKRPLATEARPVLNEVSLANGQDSTRCFCMKRKVSLVSLSSCSSCDDLTLENEGREAQIIR